MKRLTGGKTVLLLLIIIFATLFVLGFFSFGPFHWLSTGCPKGTTKVVDKNEKPGSYDYECH